MLLDLRDMHGYTLDMVWEEVRFTREHGRQFHRVAWLTSDQWVAWSAWVSRCSTKSMSSCSKKPLRPKRGWHRLPTDRVPGHDWLDDKTRAAYPIIRCAIMKAAQRIVDPARGRLQMPAV